MNLRGEPGSSNQHGKICVGIDLGTTNTGLVYTLIANGRVDGPHELSGPDGLLDYDNEDYQETSRFLTSLRFCNGDVCWRNGSQVTKIVQWFKLSLLHRDELPAELRNAFRFRKSESARDALEITAVDCIEGFLCRLLDIFWLKREEHMDKFIRSVPAYSTHFVFTVPAHWPESARKSMHNSIKKSGILKRFPDASFQFRTEPEMALIACLARLHPLASNRPESAPTFKEGQHVTICDAGGGTTDMTTWRIGDMAPFKVSEVVKGTATFSGALSLEESAVHHMKTLAANRRITPVELSGQQAYNKICGGVREHLHSFTGDRRGVYRITIDRLDPLKLTLPGIRSIFKPVIEKMTSQLGEQFTSLSKATGKQPDVVILCGGFGRNKYVQQQIKKCVRDLSGTNTEVICLSDDMPNAVAEGVSMYLSSQLVPNNTLSGKVPSIRSRSAPADYGYRMPSGVCWMILRGDSFPESEPRPFLLAPDAFTAIPGDNDFQYGYQLEILTRALDNPRGSEGADKLCSMKWMSPREISPRYQPMLILSYDGLDVHFDIHVSGRKEGTLEVLYGHEIA